MILVIDQGTTSTRGIVFGLNAEPLASAQAEFPQIYPRPGWVEHDPETLWETTLLTAREALKRAKCETKDLAAIARVQGKGTGELGPCAGPARRSRWRSVYPSRAPR